MINRKDINNVELEIGDRIECTYNDSIHTVVIFKHHYNDKPAVTINTFWVDLSDVTNIKKVGRAY